MTGSKGGGKKWRHNIDGGSEGSNGSVFARPPCRVFQSFTVKIEKNLLFLMSAIVYWIKDRQSSIIPVECLGTKDPRENILTTVRYGEGQSAENKRVKVLKIGGKFS